jgi:acetyltransferase-like isoleucine patch superfamily enzyme
LIGPGFTSGVGLRIDAFSQKAEYLVEIGKNVEVNDYVHIAAINSVKIGDNVLIASKVFITDHNHGSYTGEEQVHPDQPPGQRTLYSKEVLIENNVWLGEGTVVMPGVKIGKGSIVASNSVVTKSIAPYTIVAGSPAKAIKRFNVKTNKWEKLYK